MNSPINTQRPAGLQAGGLPASRAKHLKNSKSKQNFELGQIERSRCRNFDSYNGFCLLSFSALHLRE